MRRSCICIVKEKEKKRRKEMRKSHSVFDAESRVLIGSLSKDDDLLIGILKQCEIHGIRAGSFSCIGSLKTVSYMKLKNENGTLSYTEPVNEAKPIELLNGTGFIGTKEDGSLDIHFHGVFIDEKGIISGGHFIEGGNKVAITIEFSVSVLSNAVVRREKDPEMGFRIFNFYRKEGLPEWKQ
jgi:predicted DNA-binding protein with PD1-like motif